MNKKGFDMMIIVYIVSGVLILFVFAYLIKTGVLGGGSDINKNTLCSNLPTGEDASCVKNKETCEEMDGRALANYTYGCGEKDSKELTVCCIIES